VAFNGLKESCTDAVRVAIVILQSIIIILAGLEIVRNDSWTVI
jgi:hypothetical protein